MTDLVRTVRSGSVGLDLALGGGLRFVRKAHIGEQESATLLIRGGPGTGKSVLAQDLGLRLAGPRGGDVLYVCVEVLPSEVQAQRMGFEGYDPARVVDLSREGDRDPNAKEPHLVLGMQDYEVDAKGTPKIGDLLLALTRIAIGRGFKPKVVVVDALSDGYRLGGKAPRELVDGVCKIAVEQGWGLILIEEVADESMSSWAFAVDTVLSLRLAPAKDGAQVRRELSVTKHRFASCEPGPHRLQIEAKRIRVIPPLSAYRNAVRDLVLPLPSKDRSLQIPAKGTPPDWTAFRVADGEGRCVIVSDEVGESPDFNEIVERIGTMTSAGAPAGAPGVEVLLEDRSWLGRMVHEGRLVLTTLHQFIDGEDWLEETLAELSTWHGPVSRVFVGPTQKLKTHENFAGLQRAIWLFVSVLRERGLIAVIFGSHRSIDEIVGGAIVSDWWRVNTDKSTTVSPLFKPEITFTPALRNAR